MSITHNKNLNPLLHLLTNYISARSALQILSIKGKCTFLFSTVLIIVLCNYLLEVFSFLTVPLEAFLSRNL